MPRRRASDEPAATDGDEDRVEVGCLLLQLVRDGAGAEQGLDLVVGVHRHRAGGGDPSLAGGERVGVELAFDDELRTVAADLLELGGRGDRGHEDGGADAQPAGRAGHRGAVVAARCGGDAGGGNLPEEQVGERAARLERAGVLAQLELEDQADRRVEAEVVAAGFDDRGAADVGRDPPVDGGEALAAEVGDGLHGLTSYSSFCLLAI